MSAAVRLSGVGRSYGPVTAVRDVDLEVGRGEMLALLGPSGCGKTTTLRLIAGFETPDAGTVEVGGRTVAGPGTNVAPGEAAGRDGLPGLRPLPPPHRRAERRLRTPERQEAKARVEEVLALAHLDGLGDRMPHELSGGQQQRVALARALAPEPEVVLLDEPFSNLDAALRVRVRAEMRDILADAGATAVFVTHDQEEALSLADEVAVMMDGTVAQKAAPEVLYHSPASRRGRRVRGRGQLHARDGHESGCVRCVLGEVPALAAYATARSRPCCARRRCG